VKNALQRFLLGVCDQLALILQVLSGRSLFQLSAAALVSSALPAAWCQALPEFFGTYAVIDGKLAPMIGGRGTFTPSQTSLQVYNFQKMATDSENVFVFDGGEVHFLVFDAAVADASASVELYKLPFARNLITRPDGLAQVGGLLNQISGRGGQPQNAASPMQKYVVAKADALKVELLQKPVPGQPQMVQLVPASRLDAGVYSLFAVRMQGGQSFIMGQLFELKSGSETPYCIDLAVTGGFGGAIDASDERMARPYYLAKENYVACGASNMPSAPPTPNPPAGIVPNSNLAPAACGNEYIGCVSAGRNAMSTMDWEGAITDFRAAANLNQTSPDPWLALGRIYQRTGQREELSKAWDKAIALGGTLALTACLGRAPKFCQRGTLSLSGGSIAFAVNGKLVFSASPAEVTPDPALNGHEYSFQAAGIRYTFDFFPVVVNCAYNKAMVLCPPEGVSQQMILAQYASQALLRLARGAGAK
jgi:tetratricopeptide (TPR) repeat protein